VPQVESGRIQAFHSFTVMRLGEACLLVGRVDDARRLASRALELSQGRREQGDEAWALWLLAEIAARQEAPDAPKSERRYQEAFARAADLGMRPLVGHCHLGLGKLYHRTGKREQACEHLAAATTMYREMDMRFWLEKAEAEMKELVG
jgi:tetratricopeptide (TPR) repeat protein